MSRKFPYTEVDLLHHLNIMIDLEGVEGFDAAQAEFDRVFSVVDDDLRQTFSDMFSEDLRRRQAAQDIAALYRDRADLNTGNIRLYANVFPWVGAVGMFLVMAGWMFSWYETTTIPAGLALVGVATLSIVHVFWMIRQNQEYMQKGIDILQEAPTMESTVRRFFHEHVNVHGG